MTSQPRAVQLTSFDPPTLQLEGVLHTPAGAGPFAAAIIVHPHPLWGGTMEVPLLHQIAHALVARGFAALRFNLRGVGRSQGVYDEGRGETNDLIGALNWLVKQKKVDNDRLAVVGYSFGAWIGAQAALRDDRVQAYAAVALPTSSSFQVDLNQYERPKCFITGAQDAICSPELLRQTVGRLPPPKTLHVIPGADHSYYGYEQDVAGTVVEFFAAVL